MTEKNKAPVSQRSMSVQLRRHVVELLQCAVDLCVRGEPFPKLEASRRLGSTRFVCDAANDACATVGGERTQLQLLEAAWRVDEKSWPVGGRS